MHVTLRSTDRPYDLTVFWLALFALYAVVQSSIRVYYKMSLFGDDSELFLWARELAWGYGVQPPLYAWLQWGLNQIFGQGQIALAAMRALCLFGIYSAGFLLARRFAGVRTAGLAALGLFLIPEISQTFLRTRTHNLLVTALVPLACIAFLDLLGRRRWRDYAGFGVMAGLAILAKATGAIFLLALVLAALFRRNERRAVLAPKMLVTLGACALILMGPTLWALNNADLATASLAKFKPGGGWRTGLIALAWAIWATGGVVATALLVAVVATRSTAQSVLTGGGIIWRAGAVSILLIALAIIATDSAELKERWLVPIMAPLTPPLLVWIMQRHGWMRFLPSALGGVAAIAMLVALPDYFRDKEPPPRADFVGLARVFAATGADALLMPDDMAAGVALAAPELPVEQRVDAGPFPCSGTVLLATWPEEDLRLDRFRSRNPDCTVTETSVQTVDSAGSLVELGVFSLSPRD
jgi:4-amino-4-deoxy-L-arabinose transferase-like glycosyltransferase